MPTNFIADTPEIKALSKEIEANVELIRKHQVEKNKLEGEVKDIIVSKLTEGTFLLLPSSDNDLFDSKSCFQIYEVIENDGKNPVVLVTDCIYTGSETRFVSYEKPLNIYALLDLYDDGAEIISKEKALAKVRDWFTRLTGKNKLTADALS